MIKTITKNGLKDVNFTTASKFQTTQKLKNTGDLIILTDKEGNVPELAYEAESADPANSYRNYLFFRGSLVAGGLGFESLADLEKSTYMAKQYDTIFDRIDSLTYANNEILNDAKDYTDLAYSYLNDSITYVYDSAYTYVVDSISNLELSAIDTADIDALYNSYIGE